MTTPWVLDSPRCEECAKTLDLPQSVNTLTLALCTFGQVKLPPRIVTIPTSSQSDMHVSFRCRFCAEAMELTSL